MLNHLGYDQNGKDIFSTDREIFQGAIPKFNYGFNSLLRYKTLDLGISFIGQTGGYLFNNTALELNINNLSTDRNVLKKYVDAKANLGNQVTVSSLYLEKSDFLRLNNLRLGNTFTFKQFPWIQSFNVYVSAQNLFTITKYSGYDPLVNTDKNVNGNQ
jgi:hypothetical protein